MSKELHMPIGQIVEIEREPETTFPTIIGVIYSGITQHERAHTIFCISVPYDRYGMVPIHYPSYVDVIKIHGIKMKVKTIRSLVLVLEYID